MLLFCLAACAGWFSQPDPIPEGPPIDARRVLLEASGSVVLDGQTVLEPGVIQSNPLTGSQPALIDALGDDRRAVLVQAPGDAPWHAVRKLILSVREAKAEELWLGDMTRAYGPEATASFQWRSECTEGPMTVSEMTRWLSLDVQHGSDGTWVKAYVTFHPSHQGTTLMELPAECWDGADCSALPTERTACEATLAMDGIPKRIPVAGPVGCLLPIRKQPGDEKRWPSELSRVLTDLGFTTRDSASMLVDAQVEWSSVMALFAAFDQAQLQVPSLGSPMPQGGGHPPLCNIRTRERTQLEQAGARWFGSQLKPSGLTPREANSSEATSVE